MGTSTSNTRNGCTIGKSDVPFTERKRVGGHGEVEESMIQERLTKKLTSLVPDLRIVDR